MNGLDTNDIYFANRTGGELAAELESRVESYDRYVESAGLLQLWRRSSLMYYQSLERGKSSVGRTGEQAEYSTLFVNQFRNILQHIYITTISNRPAFLPRGVNNSYKTRAQVKLATGLLDYYFDDLGYERQVSHAAEGALVCGEWYLSQLWDDFAGDIVNVQQVPELDESGQIRVDANGQTITTSRPIYAGDPAIETHSPVDVIRDPSAESFESSEWVIVRRYINRWTLAAMYPDHKASILNARKKFDQPDKSRRVGPLAGVGVTGATQTDTVEYYLFLHKPTPAVPNGRIAAFVDHKDVLFVDTLTRRGYSKLPIYRIANGDIAGMPFGYTFAFDLIALQEILQVLYSTITTNVSNFGVAAIKAPRAAGVDARMIVEGLRLIEYNGQMGPEVFEIGLTPKHVYDFVEKIENTMETLSGVNSVARGNPEASLKSGAALALVQSQHIQFTQAFQQSYTSLVANVGTALVELFQKRVTPASQKQIAIVGRNNRSYMRELTGQDIADVRRVVVDMGNYLSRTPAGRVELATQLLNQGMIKTPEQFIEVLTTGRLDPITQAPTANADLIQSENELLLDAQPVPVLITDHHLNHLVEHQVVGADPEARENPEIMAALTAHIAEHIRLWYAMPPELAQAMGLPVLAPPMVAGPGGDPAAGGAPAAPGVPAEDAGLAPTGLPAATEPSTIAPQATTPTGVEYPMNPQTGQQWTPETGGL